jgi:hypothetical protein
MGLGVARESRAHRLGGDVCTSSTATITEVLRGADVSDSITSSASWRLSVLLEVHGAKAPSGSARAEDVASAHRHSRPCEAAALRASRASLLFPTPAAPPMTIPEESRSDMAASIIRSLSARPVSGHFKCT